jgi:hypothetical protein
MLQLRQGKSLNKSKSQSLAKQSINKYPRMTYMFQTVQEHFVFVGHSSDRVLRLTAPQFPQHLR